MFYPEKVGLYCLSLSWFSKGLTSAISKVESSFAWSLIFITSLEVFLEDFLLFFYLLDLTEEITFFSRRATGWRSSYIIWLLLISCSFRRVYLSTLDFSGFFFTRTYFLFFISGEVIFLVIFFSTLFLAVLVDLRVVLTMFSFVSTMLERDWRHFWQI